LFQQGNGVYAVNADGTAQTLLFETDLAQNRDWLYRWSPDHRRLANENDGGNDAGIVVRDRDGTNLHVVARGSVGDPVWSPDGTRLAFHCQNDNGARGICVAALDGSAPVHLTPDECCDADTPDWSPDGTRIVFRRQHSDGTQGLAIIDLATGIVTDIYSPSSASAGYAPFVQLPQWSPTGDLIAFEQEGGNTQTGLWVVNSDGTGAHAIVTNPPGTFPRWSPDGQRIAFAPSYPETSLIWIVNRDGTGGTPVPGIIRDPSAPPFDDW
jgi:TolB protein